MNAQDLFQSIYGDLPFGVLITDSCAEDPKAIFINQKFCKVTGYAPTEILGKNPKVLQGPKTDRAVIDRLKSSLRSSSPFVGSTWNYRKNGGAYLLGWTITKIKIGTESWFIAIQQDLSESSPDPVDTLQLVIRKSQITSNNLLNRISLAVNLLKSAETTDREELSTLIELSVKALFDMTQLVEFIAEKLPNSQSR